MSKNFTANTAKYTFFSGSTLKIIAMLTMFIDHIGAAFLCHLPGFAIGSNVNLWAGSPYTLYDLYKLCRNIGRIAFPIYCFLLVEGFFHTSNFKKYAFRLLLFAFLSEVPFNLAFFNKPFTFQMQNVFWTLLFGLLCISLLEKQKLTAQLKGYSANIQMCNSFLIILFFVGLATLLKTDYYGMGILLIVIFYHYRYNKKAACTIGFFSFLWEPFCFPAFLLIPLYNGKKGIPLKYLFYLFYPLHLLVLYGLRILFIP